MTPAPTPSPVDGGAAGDWIKWSGGECPVDPYTLVDVICFGGNRNFGFAARHIDWANRSQNDRTPGVTAYRVVQP